MAKELWAHCEECNADFKVEFDKKGKARLDQIISRQWTGGVGLTCPRGHRFIVASAEKSKVFVRGK
jgi:hypothetical protein